MPIREFFHLVHVVDDFDETEERYRSLLAPSVYMAKSWSDFDKRWASLAVIGPDFVLEIMEPSKAEGDRSSPLPRFRARHGQHLHSLAWFVDRGDLAGLMERMGQHGVRVLTPYAGREGGQERPTETFFTHPKDTFGQLEFQALAADGHRDPHLSSNWSGDFWRDQHPLGIERMSHITTAVADLDQARSFYAEVTDAPAFHTEIGPDRRSAFVQVGTETILELAQPTSAGSPLARDLAEHGELPHAITFKVSDLGAVAKHVSEADIGIAERTTDSIVLKAADMSNAVVGFTIRTLPGDPRLRSVD